MPVRVVRPECQLILKNVRVPRTLLVFTYVAMITDTSPPTMSPLLIELSRSTRCIQKKKLFRCILVCGTASKAF